MKKEPTCDQREERTGTEGTERWGETEVGVGQEGDRDGDEDTEVETE